ncbi:beta-ketoacyl-[acyl-carrier-protein] synthase family protein [Actinomadura barringtoniae]|uniref:Beta-ketoacyl-[acyl-carrier-protein] synthase family protein n=1 Tax=Actinomadura barringtoniae TaxID=1427535 RepID=A0A939P615_9ACTN|nr:beta-ketoacyl-[acyl-carrier-protein] synthase family protein [Actinomadura barringtoniae]
MTSVPRRVGITGIGAVSSIGFGVTEFRHGLQTGRSGISEIQSFDTTGFPRTRGGEVRGFQPERWLRRLDADQYGRTSQFAAAAARMAVTDADLADDVLARSQAGASVGTTSGESQIIEELTAVWLEKGPEALPSGLVRQLPASRLSHAVSRELTLTGESMTLATACSAANYAIAHAFDLIQSGEADLMVCGGADSVCRWAHAGFYRMGALAADECRPFDAGRDGILTGEGGAMLVLEPLEDAHERGARVYAEVLGYGLNCDATHMVAPDPDSIAECITLAHRSAGIRPDDVDYICAHGTGTPANDIAECRAVRKVFGERPPPISSIKSMIGHTMGAASGFGAIAGALAISHGFLPPTMNFQSIDPQCGEHIDCVPNQARRARVDIVENHGFAFGGNNAILILGRARES